MTKQRVLLEVCVASVEGALAAARGGADRIELNVGLEVGGLTPSPGLLRAVCAAVDLPIIAMLRPRPGGFVYGDRELDVMRRDMDAMLEAGASGSCRVHGFAVGVLRGERDEARVDTAIMRDFVRRASGRQIVCHRAIDVASDPVASIDALVEAGVTRVLTSGGRATAIEGATVIRRMVERAGERIEVIAGSGVNARNAVEILGATRVNQLHGSFSRRTAADAGPVDASERFVTDESRVRAVRAAIDLSTD